MDLKRATSLRPFTKNVVTPCLGASWDSALSEVRMMRPRERASLFSSVSSPRSRYSVSNPKALSFRAVVPSMASAMKVGWTGVAFVRRFGFPAILGQDASRSGIENPCHDHDREEGGGVCQVDGGHDRVQAGVDHDVTQADLYEQHEEGEQEGAEDRDRPGLHPADHEEGRH